MSTTHILIHVPYPPKVREQIKQEHAIFLPIRSEEKMIGMLVLLRRSDPAYKQDEFELTQLLISIRGRIGIEPRAHVFRTGRTRHKTDHRTGIQQ